VQSTRTVTLSIFCCAPSAIRLRPGVSLRNRSLNNGVPETVTIDKSGANLAADREMPIRIRQSKYLNNLVEQDHRAIKRRTRPMLGFKNFRCARILLGGIECTHMIAKGQMKCAPGTRQSPAGSILLIGNISNTRHIDLVFSAFLTATKLYRNHAQDR